jgi:hypothetical protein
MGIPVKWMPDTQSWDLQQPTVVTRLSVQDDIFPLAMQPDGNEKWDGKYDHFNEWCQCQWRPVMQQQLHQEEGQEEIPKLVGDDEGSESDESDSESGSDSEEEHQVEEILNRRVNKSKKTVQYQVKWSDGSKTWEPMLNLRNCWEAVADYDYAAAHAASAYSVRTVEEGSVLAAKQIEQLQGEDFSEACRAVVHLMGRQKVKGTPEDWVPGYWKELQGLVHKTLTELQGEKLQKVKLGELTAVQMQMLLEQKDDGRKKGRLVVRGDREPLWWHGNSTASPVVFKSSMRSMLFGASWQQDEVVGAIDVSTAFLQATEFGPGGRRKCVWYRPHPGAEKKYCLMRGPVYGTTQAPLQWFETLAVWLVDTAQAAHCSHLRSRVSVGLEAPQGKQRVQQSRRERAEQTFGSNVPDPT